MLLIAIIKSVRSLVLSPSWGRYLTRWVTIRIISQRVWWLSFHRPKIPCEPADSCNSSSTHFKPHLKQHLEWAGLKSALFDRGHCHLCNLSGCVVCRFGSTGSPATRVRKPHLDTLFPAAKQLQCSQDSAEMKELRPLAFISDAFTYSKYNNCTDAETYVLQIYLCIFTATVLSKCNSNYTWFSVCVTKGTS